MSPVAPTTTTPVTTTPTTTTSPTGQAISVPARIVPSAQTHGETHAKVQPESATALAHAQATYVAPGHSLFTANPYAHVGKATASTSPMLRWIDLLPITPQARARVIALLEHLASQVPPWG